MIVPGKVWSARTGGNRSLDVYDIGFVLVSAVVCMYVGFVLLSYLIIRPVRYAQQLRFCFGNSLGINCTEVHTSINFVFLCCSEISLPKYKGIHSSHASIRPATIVELRGVSPPGFPAQRVPLELFGGPVRSETPLCPQEWSACPRTRGSTRASTVSSSTPPSECLPSGRAEAPVSTKKKTA